MAKNQVCKARTGAVKKITNYVAVTLKNLYTYIANLKYRPLTTSFYVVDSFFDYKSGVYDAAKECTNMGAKGTNHAVLAVGYNLSASKPHIKLKNSWGPAWGESGFFRISVSKIVS